MQRHSSGNTSAVNSLTTGVCTVCFDIDVCALPVLAVLVAGEQRGLGVVFMSALHILLLSGLFVNQVALTIQTCSE